jgi:hypothetical protein
MVDVRNTLYRRMLVFLAIAAIPKQLEPQA